MSEDIFLDWRSKVLRQTAELAVRMDMCFSQILGFLVTLIDGLCTTAALGVRSSMNALSNAFALGSLLIPIESFLSTQVSFFVYFLVGIYFKLQF